MAGVSAPVLRELSQMARAANTNEQVTRMRVERLEAVLSRGLWGRLTWLVLGR